MYAVLNMGYTPSQYINLNQKERAFIIASILIKIEEEKKQQAKARNKAKVRRR
jgi:hypothetical protein